MMMPWISWMETPEARANSGKKNSFYLFFYNMLYYKSNIKEQKNACRN